MLGGIITYVKIHDGLFKRENIASDLYRIFIIEEVTKISEKT